MGTSFQSHALAVARDSNRAGLRVKIALTSFVMILLAAMPAHAQATSPLGLDDMMANFVVNINGPILHIVYLGCYTFGVYLLMKGLFKCIKYSDEGSKGQQKFSGIWGTLAVAGMLIALPTMMGTISDSLTFQNYNGQQVALSYAPDASNPDSAAIAAKVKKTYWVMVTFIQMVGLISFVRGLSILRSVTDGNTQVTSMAGLTHVIGGAIAWNIGDFVQMVGSTIGCANIMAGSCGT